MPETPAADPVPAITQRLRDDASLRRENWDSYGAAPIAEAALQAADILHRGWEATPCNDGGCCLEVHTQGWDIEIEIDPSGQPRSIYARPESTMTEGRSATEPMTAKPDAAEPEPPKPYDLAYAIAKRIAGSTSGESQVEAIAASLVEFPNVTPLVRMLATNEPPFPTSRSAVLNLPTLKARVEKLRQSTEGYSAKVMQQRITGYNEAIKDVLWLINDLSAPTTEEPK